MTTGAVVAILAWVATPLPFAVLAGRMMQVRPRPPLTTTPTDAVARRCDPSPTTPHPQETP